MAKFKRSPPKPQRVAPILRRTTIDAADILKPPTRRKISETAATHVPVREGGATWSAARTPYMVEPMDQLRSRTRRALIFVGPSRSGKTQALVDCWLTHIILCEPGDIGLFFSVARMAHDFRLRRIERLFKRSEEIKSQLSSRYRDNGLHLIIFRNGMMLNLSWPTSGQVSQRDLVYSGLSDYDSMPDSLSKEGSPFDLARARVQNAGSRGMIMAESSPKRLVIDTDVDPDGPHQAPPTDGGIMPIFNRGSRCLWHWTCLRCRVSFEAPPLPDYADKNPSDAHVACPHCGHRHDQKDRDTLNASGRWIPEKGREDSPFATYWLKGTAAGFKDWEQLASSQVNAEMEYERTSSEAALITCANTEQGIPYRPRVQARIELGEMKARLESETPHYKIPDGVRLLYASVDVQKRAFEVAVWGYGRDRERWLVDRYAIRKTESGKPVQPASFIEHWDEVTRRVVLGTYKLADGREVLPYHVAVDSGGYAERGGLIQVAARSHAWWRKLGPHRNRVMLVRGEVGGWMKDLMKKTYPKSGKGSRGDVPVLVINVNHIKDMLVNDMARDIPGPGYIHLPGWLTDKHLAEFFAERKRGAKWTRFKGKNESWDLLVYADSVWHFDGCERIDWANPPPWADLENDANPNIITRKQRVEVKSRVSMISKRKQFVDGWR